MWLWVVARVRALAAEAMSEHAEVAVGAVGGPSGEEGLSGEPPTPSEDEGSYPMTPSPPSSYGTPSSLPSLGNSPTPSLLDQPSLCGDQLSDAGLSLPLFFSIGEPSVSGGKVSDRRAIGS